MVIDSLARMFGAPRAVDWWRGVDDIWRWGARVREIWAYDAASPAEQATIRLRRTAALLEHARTHSAFFRAHYRYVVPGCTELASYPPVTRKQLMGSFDDCASSTMRMICARTVSPPTAVALNVNAPV